MKGKRIRVHVSEEQFLRACENSEKKTYTDFIKDINVRYCNEIITWHLDKHSRSHNFLYIANLEDKTKVRLFQKEGIWFYIHKSEVIKVQQHNIDLLPIKKEEYAKHINDVRHQAYADEEHHWYSTMYEESISKWHKLVLMDNFTEIHKSRYSCYIPIKNRCAYDIFFKPITAGKYNVAIFTYIKYKDAYTFEPCKSMITEMNASELIKLAFKCDELLMYPQLKAIMYCYIRKLCPSWDWFELMTMRNIPRETEGCLLLYGLKNDDEILKAYLRRLIDENYHHSETGKISEEEAGIIKAYNELCRRTGRSIKL